MSTEPAAFTDIHDSADELLELLAALVRDHGAERLLRAPLIDGSSRCFPEPFEPSLLGVAQQLVPLLVYAELGSYTPELIDARVVLDDVEPTLQPQVELVGVEEHGVVAFQVEQVGAHPAALVGALAYEVARAWVATRDAEHPYRQSRDPSALLSEAAKLRAAAATIYLGFGVISVAASHAFHQSGEIVGNAAMTYRSHQFVGPLAAADMSLLFAAQLCLRGETARSAAPLLRQLGANQQRAVRELLEALEPRREALAARLRVPAELLAGAGAGAETGADAEGADVDDAGDVDALPALPDPLLDAALLEQVAAAERSYERPNVGVEVRRYYEHKTLSTLFIGVFIALVPAFVLVANEQVALAALPLVAGATAGALIGRRRRQYFCGACWMLLRADETARCPRCGATLGEVAPTSQRAEHLDEASADGVVDVDELTRQALAARRDDFGEDGRV